MAHTSRLAVALLLLPGCQSDEPTDAERIVGDWVVVDFHSPHGTEDRTQRRKHAVVTAGTWSQQFSGDQFEDFEYALDPYRDPKAIDLAYTTADGRRVVVLGVYTLTADRLHLCLGPPVAGRDPTEDDRPTGFDGRGLSVMYRRKTWPPR